MIWAFIAEHRARFGVTPICRVLIEHGCQIAPRTFYARPARAPSKQALSDLALTGVLAGFYEPDVHGTLHGYCVRPAQGSTMGARAT